MVQFPGAARTSAVKQAKAFMHDLHRGRGLPGGPFRPADQQSLAFSPPCRLKLEGGDVPDASCEILALSSEGVKIAIRGGRSVHKGQQGRLLIGPPDGDHYELPVNVSWVETEASIAVLDLSLPKPPHWRFARS